MTLQFLSWKKGIPLTAKNKTKKTKQPTGISEKVLEIGAQFSLEKVKIPQLGNLQFKKDIMEITKKGDRKRKWQQWLKLHQTFTYQQKTINVHFIQKILVLNSQQKMLRKKIYKN